MFDALALANSGLAFTLEEAAVYCGVFSSDFLGDAVLLFPKREFCELLFSFKKPKLASGFLLSVYAKSPPLGFFSFEYFFKMGVSFVYFFNCGYLNKLSDFAEALKSPGYFLSSDSFLSLPKAGDSRNMSDAGGLPNKPAPPDGFAGAAPNNDLDSLFALSNLFLETK